MMAAGIAAALITGCSSSEAETTAAATEAATEAAAEGEAEAAEEPAGEPAEAGVIWYNFADTFIANATSVPQQCGKS